MRLLCGPDFRKYHCEKIYCSYFILGQLRVQCSSVLLLVNIEFWEKTPEISSEMQSSQQAVESKYIVF